MSATLLEESRTIYRPAQYQRLLINRYAKTTIEECRDDEEIVKNSEVIPGKRLAEINQRCLFSGNTIA